MKVKELVKELKKVNGRMGVYAVMNNGTAVKISRNFFYGGDSWNKLDLLISEGDQQIDVDFLKLKFDYTRRKYV